MTPLNGHILTPKIHHVLSSLSRRSAAVPERPVYRSSRLTGTTLTSQSARTHPCAHTLGYPQTNTGERSCEIPRELPLRYKVPALARHRRSLALPVTPLAAGRPDKPKQRKGASVGSRGAGAHQSRWLRPDCWLPQPCGSGTLCRWKTEEGEWVIMRVLAPVLPTQNSTAHKRGPLTARHVWVF